MMRRLLWLLPLLGGCSDLKPLPLVDNAATAEPRSAIQQMIRLQLNSQATEPPPAPAPGSETERFGTLLPLPGTTGAGQRQYGSGQSGSSQGAGSSGMRAP